MKRLALILLLTLPLAAQTISEKRTQLIEGRSLSPTTFAELAQVNQEIEDARADLRALHALGQELAREEASDETFQTLVEQIQALRREIAWMEEAWRQRAVETGQQETYALWHQPWTSLEQLILDYGSADYVYLIPPEVGGIRLSVASNLPVPRQSWDEMLLAILAENGVGMRQLGPFVRQLFVTGSAIGKVTDVVASREELSAVEPHSRICFVLPAGQATSALIERLFDNRVQCHRVGAQLFLFGTKVAIEEVLRMHAFVAEEEADREHQLVPLVKISASEMAKVLELSFEETPLKILALEEAPYALYLSGREEEITRARAIIEEIERELANPRAMTVHTYTSKHTDVEELAYTMSAVYNLLLANPEAGLDDAYEQVRTIVYDYSNEKGGAKSNLPINPKLVTSNRLEPKPEGPSVAGNFVVYPKAGTMIMVVEQELLPKLQSLLNKLDIPKKMVRIDVLFFEKKLEDRSRFGLDLLRLGSRASGKSGGGAGFDASDNAANQGILQFFLSAAKRKGTPAYDLAYNFLLSQEDIRVNANPSVTTLNNTPATIELVEEMSIDTGVYIDEEGADPHLRRSFTRQQYGITMSITPTVHTTDGGSSTITLATDLLFDTPKPATNDRPPVLRRHITNEVRVGDGETVILGGLRSTMSEDESASLPFIGEIPGIGKLFSSSKMRDRENEMFIFITPHIIENPEEELRRLRAEELARRPGDIPEFLSRLQEAKETEKQVLFHRSLRTLVGGKRD